jgi:ribonuclease P protein component
VSLRFADDGSTDPPRVAYAIGRRVGSAVDRNRIRRRLRGALAGCRDDLVPGGAYLFDADRTVLTVAYADLSAAVGSLVARAKESRS